MVLSLSRENLTKLYRPVHGLEDIFEVVKKCEDVMGNGPSYVTIDPRDFEVNVYSDKRRLRPYDISEQKKKDESESNVRKDILEKGECVICKGFFDSGNPTTTPVISYDNFSDESYSFTNINKFPVAVPEKIPIHGRIPEIFFRFNDDINSQFGVHLLSWATNFHRDVHQMSSEEHVNCLENILKTQELLFSGNGNVRFYSQLIKNTGGIAGCSLEHGHYQMVFSNIPSGKNISDFKFRIDNGISFAEHVRKENPSDLEIEGNYGSVRLVVPYVTEKPFELMIFPKNSGISNFRDISDERTFSGLSQAIIDCARVFYYFADFSNKPFGYNIEFHEGLTKDDEMYVELIPSTQITAGLELLGYNVCQQTPESSSKLFNEILKELPENPEEYSIVP